MRPPTFLVPSGTIRFRRCFRRKVSSANTKFPSRFMAIMVLYGTSRGEKAMAPASMSKRRQEGRNETAVRARILDAAFAAFVKHGYATTSTLEIATRACVSKRELYALVGNKQEMLIACIRERARRLDVPSGMLVVRDRESLAHILTSFGTQFLCEVSDP